MEAHYRRGSGAPCLTYLSIRRLPAVKWATQVELFKGLVRGRAFIARHFADRGVLQAAAREAAMSPFHFTRLFRRLFGQTPVAFRTALRLRAARELLAETEMSIGEVCQEVGFESLPSFSQLFRRRFGVTPTQFRAQRRAS